MSLFSLDIGVQIIDSFGGSPPKKDAIQIVQESVEISLCSFLHHLSSRLSSEVLLVSSNPLGLCFLTNSLVLQSEPSLTNPLTKSASQYL